MKSSLAHVLVLLSFMIWTESRVPAQENTLGMWKFAFGTPDSVLRSGFTKVTIKEAFSPQKGFGFASTQGLEAFDRSGSEIVLPKDEYTASVYGAYRTTSDLTCALIEGTTENAFYVAMPDGEYTVWLIASDAEWDPPHQFVDRQLRGPYTLWHHTHTFMERDGATLCLDCVRYRPRGGALINWLSVRRDVERIFQYRHQRMQALLGTKADEMVHPAINR